ncbi:MAG TPA: ABC transporter permease [Candidatus Woesebacteria bacterium]|jgi:putative ABC transport system permease protein|nr:ABC transporter permease [Candidatus Shapirobacteria bacterium]HOR02158.1 ABC transporter permease [Candidatus Woesebacteria bacterium]
MRKFKPSFEDLLRSSLRSVLKNKSRTILTSLGVIIGVTSVILLTSIGTGLKKYINDQFETLGSNTLFVTPGQIFKEGGGFNQNSSSMITISFKPKDISNLKKTLKNVIILPEKSFSAEVKSKDYKKSTTIVGSTYLYGPHGNALPSDGNGRWFTKEEDEKNALVAVLGQKIAKDLFPNTTALGKKFIIKGKSLKVVGIEDARGSSMGGPSIDEFIFVPIGLANDLAGDENIQEIMVKTSTKDQVDSTKKTIEKIFLKDYNKDSFSVFDSAQLLTSINSIISTLTVALTGIAAISLVVGGIGIMNIMLVTVSERTREIGLRKAIGAYPRAILLQFLFEAVILSGLGGSIGIILGILGTMAINQIFPAQVTLGSILLAFGVSFIVGIIFGVTPARKASQLSPIEALRYE